MTRLMAKRRALGWAWVTATWFAIAGCEGDDPVVSGDSGGGDATSSDGGTDAEARDGGSDASADASALDSALEAGPIDAGPGDAGADAGPMCTHAPSDYVPDITMRDAALWPACISDDGAFHAIDPSISSIARVAAFEQVATLLFDYTADPPSADFDMARLAYVSADPANGLASRVARRRDFYYASTAPAGTTCRMAGEPAMYPDFCAGPAKLQPIIDAAFASGMTGAVAPRSEAARIEAALVWFLYLSTYSETTTCADVARDCDSACAYYSGGEPARLGIGLARYGRLLDPLAHDRAWDALLGVRCWRNLDNESGIATDLAMRDRVREQYGRAVLDVVGAIVRDRVVRFAAATGTERDAHWAFVRTIGPWLDRVAVERDATAAATLRAEVARMDVTMVDVPALLDALGAIFVCP